MTCTKNCVGLVVVVKHVLDAIMAPLWNVIPKSPASFGRNWWGEKDLALFHLAFGGMVVASVSVAWVLDNCYECRVDLDSWLLTIAMSHDTFHEYVATAIILSGLFEGLSWKLNHFYYLFIHEVKNQTTYPMKYCKLCKLYEIKKWWCTIKL